MSSSFQLIVKFENRPNYNLVFFKAEFRIITDNYLSHKYILREVAKINSRSVVIRQLMNVLMLKQITSSL